MTSGAAKIWLLGDGRSGTTWVANLINHHRRYRTLFEPFHPTKVAEMSFLKANEYVSIGTKYPALEIAVSRVFEGQIDHSRVTSSTSIQGHHGILSKDIFANLFAPWACDECPSIKPILLLRNPFAVALSKQKKSNWTWHNDPRELLNQPLLKQDVLAAVESLIHETLVKNDPFLEQILFWSIINYVPLTQFAKGALHVMFYENIYLDPGAEIHQLQKFTTLDDAIELDHRIVHRASKASDTQSNVVIGRSPLNLWQTELTKQQISGGLKILDGFGLAELYSDDVMPNNGFIESFDVV